MKKIKVTANEIERIKSRYIQGDTYKKIAQYLDINPSRIAVLVNNLIDDGRMKQRPQRSSRKPSQISKRMCLKCKKHFLSQGSHNRICNKCTLNNSTHYNHPFAKETEASGVVY